MTIDAFEAVVHELGEELLGFKWLLVRGRVHAWIEENPERVAWLRRRLRRLAREGRL